LVAVLAQRSVTVVLEFLRAQGTTTERFVALASLAAQALE